MGNDGWLGLAALAITALFAWLGKRDSLRHDSDLSKLKSENAIQAVQIATLTASHASCQENHAATEKKLEECEEKHEQTDRRLLGVEAAIAQMKK